jgi:AraC family transcriptional regulator
MLGSRETIMQPANMHITPTVSPTVRTASTRNFRLSERNYLSNTESPLHAHAKPYIIITLDGRYFSTFGTRTEEFKRWTVSFHKAGASHTSRYAAEGAKVLYVELPLERLKEFSEASASHLNTVSMQGGLAEWTARQLYNEFNEPDDLSSVVLDGLVLQLFAQLWRRQRELPQSLPTWLGRADELIRERFLEPLGLVSIAKAVHVHPVHLAREYRRHYSCTVGEQIRRLRVDYACAQLSETNRSLADIALASGFCDQSHFTVGFKQQIGTAPSQYRRAMQTMLLLQKKPKPLQDCYA